MNKSGLSLLELLVGAGFLVFIAVIGATAVKTTLRMQSQLGQKGDVTTQVFLLARNLEMVGRFAGAQDQPPGTHRACWNPSQIEVDCLVDFKSTGTTTRVQFLFNAATKTVTYSREQSPGSWPLVSTVRYQSINQFVVCGDVEMALPAPTCPLQPTGISTAYSTYILGATNPHRFYRFFIEGVAPPPTQNQIQVHPVVYQGAFYVRNPPFPGDTTTIYKWPGG